MALYKYVYDDDKNRVEFIAAPPGPGSLCLLMSDGIRSRQVALLSLRGRAMLRVIDYFAKSLKVTQGHSK